jgi:peptidoglycan/LPS O-acetylase OafA/YrhL
MPSDQSQLAVRPVTGRIDSLDSIRRLAALAVLLSHFCGVFVMSNAVNTVVNLPVVNIGIDGKAGVAMFFVLSGFVLARPYLRVSPGGGFASVNVGSFYLRRVTRIYIPFLFVLVLSAAVCTWLFRRHTTLPPQTGWFSGFWCCPVTARDLLKQCGFLLHDGQRQMLNQDWSLGVELKASLLLPIYVFIARKSFLALAATGLGLAIFMGTGHYQLSFVMGVLLACFIPAVLPKLKAAASRVRAAIFVGGVLAYGTRLLTQLISEHSQIPVLPEKIIWTMTALGCVAILLAALSSRRLDMVLNHPSLTFLGTSRTASIYCTL